MLTGTNDGGTFTITVGGHATPPLAWNESGANLQTALTALSSVGAGNCTVSQDSTDQYLITFALSLGAIVATADLASLTPGNSGESFTLNTPYDTGHGVAQVSGYAC